MSNPFLIKGMRETVERLLGAVTKKERIIILTDADPDGVTSAVILKEALEVLGNPPFFVYFPNIEKEGYGLSETALNFLKDKSPALLMTLDCGIGNFREIELAKKNGFEVIVVDHHEILGELPRASIIIDPKQEKDESAFRELCAAGLVYKLARALLFEAQVKFAPERFLELAVIATLSDQMPRIGENEKILNDGLLSLKYTERKGLKALIEVSGLREFDQNEIREKIISPLASAGLKNHKSEAYLLLTENSFEKSVKMAKALLKKSKLRRERVSQIFEEAEERIDASLPLVFLGDPGWPVTLVGTVASKIHQKYKRPTFIFKKGKTKSRGSVRTPKEINSVKMMASCSSLLETYGGHSQASGFAIKNQNLEKFKECLINFLLSQ